MKRKFLTGCVTGFFSLALAATSYAQTLGDVSMAAAAGAALDAGGSGYLSPSEYARRALTRGSDDTIEFGEDSDPDFLSALSNASNPKNPAIFGRPPELPAPKTIPLTGSQLVQELLSPLSAYQRMRISTTSTPQPGTATASRFFAQLNTKATRLKVSNWRAYYLPGDRIKFQSGAWKFVTIEDDYGAYPMGYYYRPWSAPMILMLSDPRRRGRVIGFRNWQEAMLAGYRPDPISKPEPGAELFRIANITKTREGVSGQLGSYLEYLYNGLIQESAFRSHYAYALQINSLLLKRADTRPYIPDVVSSVFGQAVGVGEVPQTVGGSVALQTGEVGGASAVLKALRREDARTYR